MTRTIRNLFARVLTGGACLLPLAAPAVAFADEPAQTAPVAAPMNGKQLHQLLAHGSGWIQHKIPGGMSHGTGWILDAENRLMVTNDHVVEGTDHVEVVFPIWKDGKIVNEEAAYNSAPRIKAVVIDRDRNRDLALIKLESIPSGMKAIKLATTEPEAGEDIRLIGGFTNGGDGLVWGSVNGTVRTVGPQSSLKGRGMIRQVLSNAPTNGGNSGSAVVNAAGELVAVHSAIKNKANGVSMHISVVELKEYVQEAVPLAEAKTASELLARGKRRQGSGRFEIAIDDFSAALAEDETLTEAVFFRGKAYGAMGETKRGLADLDAAVKADKENYDYRIARGIALRKAGKFDDAVADFSAAIDARPGRMPAYNERGITHLSAKRFADAETDFTKAIELAESDPVLWGNRGDARLDLKKFDEAASDYRKAAKLDPRDAYYPNNLGVALLGKGNPDEAVAAFTSAVATSNGHPLHLTNLGDALRAKGDFKAAAKAYSDAIKNWAPNAPANRVASSYAGRGMAFRELNEFRDSVDDLTKAIELTGGKVAWYFQERSLSHKAAGATDAADDDMATATKLDPTLKAVEKIEKVDFVGTWQGTVFANGARITQRITFKADGTFTGTMTTSNEFGAVTRIRDTGTWTVKGNKLTIRGDETGTVTRLFKKSGDDVVVELEELGRNVTFSRDE